MKLFFKSLYKKRVVSTLFLYLLILSCDFESPQKWEKPTWYLPMTIPLINQTYSFEGLVDSTIIFSDSINNVIQIVFSDTIPKNGIPDAIFNISMPKDATSIPEIDLEDINIEAPQLPSIDLPLPPIPNPVFNSLYTSTSNCFPLSKLEDLQTFINDASDLMVGEIPIDIEGISNDDIKINKIIITEGSMSWAVTNNWSVPMRVVFELKNAGKDFFKSNSVIINPYTTADTYIEIINSNNSKTIDLESPTFNYSVRVDTVQSLVGPSNGLSPAGCEVYTCPLPATEGIPFDASRCTSSCPLATCSVSELGWTINSGGLEELEFEFKADFTTIGAVVADINIPIPPTEPISIAVPGMDGISIKRAKFDEFSTDYPNQFEIVIYNGFYKNFNMIMNFNNIFKYELESNPIKLTEPVTGEMTVEPGQTDKFVIDISDKFLASGPDSEEPVESITISYDVSIDPVENDTLYFIDGQLSFKMPKIDSISVSNLRLQYIASVIETLDIPPIPDAPISGIPDGFGGFEFSDIIMEIEFFNEIGVPVTLDMELLGIKKDVVPDTKIVKIPSTILPAYDNDIFSFDCNFNTIGDIARTVIKLDKDSQITEYYCNPSDLEPIDVVPAPVSASIVEILNFAPDTMKIGGSIEIDGEGILAPGAKIWGEFTLIAPLAFIFKEPINIIPAEATAMAPIDPSSSSQMDSALVEAGLNVKISNSSALGGNLSLLVSDSTIFPLFLDSLITGLWEDQLYDFNTSIWDTLDPPLEVDSINYKAIDPEVNDENRQALKVEFYKDDNLQFFIGRMFELGFPATDSVEYNLGYINPDFPKSSTSTLVIDTTRMNWVLSEENRYNIAMINFNKSISDPRNATKLVPLTFQTTNFLDVQAYLTLVLNVGQLGREKDITDE